MDGSSSLSSPLLDYLYYLFLLYKLYHNLHEVKEKGEPPGWARRTPIPLEHGWPFRGSRDEGEALSCRLASGRRLPLPSPLFRRPPVPLATKSRVSPHPARAPHDAPWARQAPPPLVSAPVVRRTSPPVAHPSVQQAHHPASTRLLCGSLLTPM